MYLSSHDALLLAGAISLLFVSGFLCWVLFELGRMLRQANDVLEDTREKIDRIESFVSDVSERIGSASQYLGVMATAGKEIFGWMRERKERNKEDDFEREVTEAVKRKRKH
jgi:hypothetical protein